MKAGVAAVELPLARDRRTLFGRVKGAALGAAGTLLLGGSVVGLFNVLQTSSLVIRPFSGSAFRRANRFLAGTWWSWCVGWMENVLDVQVEITGDPIPKNENAIVVANHQQMPDILALMAFAGRQGCLGDMKWFVKDALKFVPGIGWGMLYLDCLFVKRDWAADRGRIDRTFSKFRKYRVPFWLVSFVESTRITPAKLARAQEFARKRGVHVPRNVLVPRSRGFIASVQGLGDLAEAVYDVTIAFEGGIPTLWQFMTGLTPRIALDVRRFPREQLPADDEELAHWLSLRFIEKDERLERFRVTGRLD